MTNMIQDMIDWIEKSIFLQFHLPKQMKESLR